LASQVLAIAGERTESPDRALCIPVSHVMISEIFVFLSHLYIKLCELGVEVAFYNRSALAYFKVDLLKYPCRSRCSERTNDSF